MHILRLTFIIIMLALIITYSIGCKSDSLGDNARLTGICEVKFKNQTEQKPSICYEGQTVDESFCKSLPLTLRQTLLRQGNATKSLAADDFPLTATFKANSTCDTNNIRTTCNADNVLKYITYTHSQHTPYCLGEVTNH